LADLVSEEDTAFGRVHPLVRLSVRLFPLYVFTNEALTLIFLNLHVWTVTTARQAFKIKVIGQGQG